MYRFQNDYSETAHPKVLEAIMETVGQRHNGYGLDSYCQKAAELIKQRIRCEEAEVHFFNGGTITNLTVISHILHPYQAVIAPETGHVATHETGAIEATGHKVIPVVTETGKLTPALLEPIMLQHSDEHWVQPKMVYITQSTELGTVYTREELSDIYRFCQKHRLYLYLDGARLASGLMSPQTDMTIEDVAALTDVFYIGGTKIGALSAEAVVMTNDELTENFRFSVKQKGGLQAKGWLLGAQFCALFENNLYFSLGRHANEMAERLVALFKAKECEFLAPPESNQLFVIFPDAIAKQLQAQFALMFVCAPKAGYTCLRLCTSWSTTDDDINDFAERFEKMYC